MNDGNRTEKVKKTTCQHNPFGAKMYNPLAKINGTSLDQVVQRTVREAIHEVRSRNTLNFFNLRQVVM